MFKFLQPTTGTIYERKATSSASRLTAREQLAENIRKQKQLFQATPVRQPDGRTAYMLNGQEVLTREKWAASQGTLDAAYRWRCNHQCQIRRAVDLTDAR